MLAIFFSPEERNHCPQKFKVWQLVKEFKLDLLHPIQELAQHRSFIEIEERSKEGDLKERGREKGGWGLGEEEEASEKGRKSSSSSPTPLVPAACHRMESPGPLTSRDQSLAGLGLLALHPHLTPHCANLVCAPSLLRTLTCNGATEAEGSPRASFKVIPGQCVRPERMSERARPFGLGRRRGP